jgi:DUF1680 family protein
MNADRWPTFRLAGQDASGTIRYHNPLPGAKEAPQCQGTCCECSAVGLPAKLPENVYSTDPDGLCINLFAPSQITSDQRGHRVALIQATTFPFDAALALTLETPAPLEMDIPIPVPSWAAGPMEIKVNGERTALGAPGRCTSLRRKWAGQEVIRFTLPMRFTTVKYTWLDQAPDHVDRCALLYGPILMALNDTQERICTAPATLPGLLAAVTGRPLHYEVPGTGYQYLPYWQVSGGFTCCPMVQP